MSIRAKITATGLLAVTALTACTPAVDVATSAPDDPGTQVPLEDDDRDDAIVPVREDVAPADEPLTVVDDIVAAETTTILDETARAGLVEVTREGTLRFAAATPQLEAIEVGDVLVSRPSVAAPAGIFRKVSGVERDPHDRHGLRIETVEATLDEAFDEGEFLIEVGFGGDGEATYRMVMPESMRGADLTRELFLDWGETVEVCPQPTDVVLPPGRFEPVNPCIVFEPEVTLTPEDCGRSRRLASLSRKVSQRELVAGVTVAGEVDLALTACVYVSITKGVFIGMVGGEQSANLDLRASGDHAQLNEEITIASQDLARARFGPLTVSGVLDLVLGVEGSLQADAAITLDQQAAVHAGVGYKKGWHNLSNADFTLEATLEVTGPRAKVQGYLAAKPTLRLALVEVCVPFAECASLATGSAGVSAKVFAEADAEDGRNPYCRLVGGLAIDVFASLQSVFGFIKEDYTATVYRHEVDVFTCPEEAGSGPGLVAVDDGPGQILQPLEPRSDEPSTGIDTVEPVGPTTEPSPVDPVVRGLREVVDADRWVTQPEPDADEHARVVD